MNRFDRICGRWWHDINMPWAVAYYYYSGQLRLRTGDYFWHETKSPFLFFPFTHAVRRCHLRRWIIAHHQISRRRSMAWPRCVLRASSTYRTPLPFDLHPWPSPFFTFGQLPIANFNARLSLHTYASQPPFLSSLSSQIQAFRHDIGGSPNRGIAVVLGRGRKSVR